METTIVNKFGKLAGWNSVTVNMLGRDIEGISSVKYDDDTDKSNVFGAGKFPVGRGEGNYTANCTLGLLKETVDAITLALPPRRRMQDITPFDVTVQYEYSDGRIITDRIRNCEFTNRGIDVKNGDGSITTEFELIVSHIDWNTI